MKKIFLDKKAQDKNLKSKSLLQDEALEGIKGGRIAPSSGTGGTTVKK